MIIEKQKSIIFLKMQWNIKNIILITMWSLKMNLISALDNPLVIFIN